MSEFNLQWGTGDDKKMEGKAEIGKKSIDITNSLDKAIRRLRHEKDSVMIWADQICIDQKTQAEKEAQVRLMPLIYSRALNTVIWLGDTSAEDAFNALHDLEDTTTSHSGPLPIKSKDRASNDELIATVVNNPWFQRTWTTQNACL
jgi:hypothetical protein